MSAKEKLLVSSCLLGENVKYNGKNNKIDISFLKQRYDIVPFCPEVEGGLPTPRPPSEIVSYNPIKVININKEDVTKFFIDGAKKALDNCLRYGIKKALLKEGSPSCGKNFIYDGSFSSNIIASMGISARLLQENGVNVFCEDELHLV